jgi:aminoglycoside 3-N-acetyltransferase
MLTNLAKRLFDDRQRRAVKATLNSVKKRFIDTFRRYDADDLKRALQKQGIRETDTLFVHANFPNDSGFAGVPLDLVNALADLVGEKGNLLMVSIPFRGSAYDHLDRGKPFNVKKTLSMMGLVTEMFRRREGTLRSLHPTHPVLAMGKDAADIVAGHEDSPFPCGEGTPFAKFRDLGGKILFYDVSFGGITFFHHVEEMLRDRIPFEIFHDRIFSVTAIDSDGEEHTVETRVYNPELKRDAFKLEAEMIRQGKLEKGRVGNSHFILVSAEDVVSCFSSMVEAGDYPYEL